MTNHLLQQLPSPVAVFKGESFAVELANDKLLEIWGKKAHEVLHQSYFALFPQANQDGLKEIYQHVYQTGQPYVREAVPTAYVLNGTPVEEIYKIILTPVKDGSGCIEGIMAAGYDITGQKKMLDNLDKKLREISEYKYALDESSIVAITDQKGVIQYVNDQFCKISKYSREELLGQDHRLINSGYHDKDYIRNLWVTIASGKIWKGELKNKAKDGSDYWVDTTIVPFLNENGKPYQYIAIRSDITARKEAEQKLKESEAQYRSAFENAAVGVSHVATDGSWLLVNERFCQITGYSKEEMLQLTFQQITHPEDLYIDMTFLQEVQEGKRENYSMEKRYIRKDRSVVWINLAVSAVRHPDRSIKHFISVVEDINARKAAEIALKESESRFRNLAAKLETLVEERTKELAEANNELQRSNEDLLHFAHVASHDLKEPIRKIRTFQDRLDHEFGVMLPEMARFYLSKIGVAARRGQDMIEGILLYSSLNHGDHKLETVDLNKVMENIKTDLEVLITQKGATIDYGGLPELEGYAELLNQLLYNLLSNSLKFTKPGLPPVIKVNGSIVPDNLDQDARQTKKYVQLTVQDNGIGFPQEFADRVFETFSRLHSKDKFEGSGLGLALCKRIAERHGGYIKAEGIEGEGATFKIFLPQKQGS